MNITGVEGKIIVNGKTYHGKSVSMKNNQLYIDGVLVETINTPVIDVKIEGNCHSVLNEVGDVTVNGQVTGGVKNSTGDITCGNIVGDVTNEVGDISCGKVTGSVKTGVGDINKRG